MPYDVINVTVEAGRADVFHKGKFKPKRLTMKRLDDDKDSRQTE